LRSSFNPFRAICLNRNGWNEARYLNHNRRDKGGITGMMT
jgi:hypothetical protein